MEIVMEIVTSWNRLKQYGCASAGEAMSETYPDSLKATKAQTIVFFIEGAPSTLHTILRGGVSLSYNIIMTLFPFTSAMYPRDVILLMEFSPPLLASSQHHPLGQGSFG